MSAARVWDRYAARNEHPVHVAPPHSGPRRANARQADADTQPRSGARRGGARLRPSTSRGTWLLCVSALFAGALAVQAQNGSQPDPRVGLKPGFRDAGEAARNMERVASLPKPDGFFDPKAPAGPPTAPERQGGPGRGGAASADPSRNESDTDNSGRGRAGGAAAPAATALGFANSDIAFSGNLAFVGSYHGFNIYDIEIGRKPRLISSAVCPGGQGDMSVYGNLLIMSVEQTRGRVDCGVQGVQDVVSRERMRGIRVFDISDLRNPRQVAAVQTCRGSHTHTLIVDPDDRQNIYIYGSGTGAVRSAQELEECSGKDPKEDSNTALFSIDVIQIPLAAPDKARVVNRPRIFADPATGAISGLWQGGNHGDGTQTSRVTNQCHDITAYPELGLAAGACSGNGILLDISDPVNPVRVDHVVDKNFAYWHSATFSNDGRKVVFTDEWGGGTRPRCRATDPATWGADAVFAIVDRKLQFAGYYKLPAPQSEIENCVAHNGSLIPVPGRDIMVQGWYQGGVSIFDFTDPARPVEIAFFDRGPVDEKQLITAGYWSTYWYNGFIYGTEIARGIDVFRLTPSEHLSKNEIDAATEARQQDFNPQHQRRVEWPASSAVARAYVDQLIRSNALTRARAEAIDDLLEDVDELRTGRERAAAATLNRLATLAGQIDAQAGSATGRDADRLRALATTLRGRAARFR
jgi:hypothetical protein